MLKENFVRMFEDALRLYWDRPSMSDYGQTKIYTFGEVAAQVERLHVLFKQCGVEKQDKIALIGRNSSNWAMTYIACITYGAIVVPILQDFKPGDVTHIINHSESKLLFSGDAIWENLDLHAMPEVKAVFSLTNFAPLAIQERKLSEKEQKEAMKNAKELQKAAEKEWEAAESAAKKAAKKAGEKYDKKKYEPADLVVSDVMPVLDSKELQPARIEELFQEKYNHDFYRDRVRYDWRDNSEIASINYTSGTTGFSKGVVTPLNALAGNVAFGFETKIVRPGTRFMCFLPLAHAYGCAFDFLSCFCAGGYTCYYGRPLAAKILLQAFEQIRPTTIFTVPLIIEKIYKKMIQPLLTDRKKSWVFTVPGLSAAVHMTIRNRLIAAFGGEFDQIIIGGAALNPEVEAFFRKIKFPFTVGYGMTECAPLISFAPHNEFVTGSCGRILPLMEARITDPNSAGVGEIEVRGENVMAGYYKNDAATKDVFTEDGWLRTGDLGIIDEGGNLFIKGRSKTMLLGPSGQNIYPEEIEDVLNNMPYVLESLVMQHEDKLVALVCPDMEQADHAHLTHTQLVEQMEENRKQVNSQVAAYEQLNQIRIYPHEFEKTPKKSIKRFLYNATMGE
ncbi:MAG: AMP-binding protein [Paludibacteraceae bacterium]|nr:AMP-binding protein [Paludibacteraceae bacterium]